MISSDVQYRLNTFVCQHFVYHHFSLVPSHTTLLVIEQYTKPNENFMSFFSINKTGKRNADQLQLKLSRENTMDNFYSNTFLQSYLSSNIYFKTQNFDPSNVGIYESPDMISEDSFQFEDYWRSKYSLHTCNNKP